MFQKQLSHQEVLFHLCQCCQDTSLQGTSSKARRTEAAEPACSEQQIVSNLTHVLLLKEPWLTKILDGCKSLELRSQNTTKRGRIGLGIKDKILGYCELTDSQRLTCAEVFSRRHEHLCPLDLVTYKEVYGWSLASAKRLSSPAPLPRKHGQIVWVVHEGAKPDQAPATPCPAPRDPSPAPIADQVEPSADASPDALAVHQSESDVCAQVAVKLEQANAAKFNKLKQIAPKYAEQGRKTARGQIPDLEAACVLCQRARHSCKWETYKAPKRNGHRPIRTKGGSCYSCVRSCALFRCSRSIRALKEAGLVEVIAEMSKAVAKTQTPDLCTCSKAACVEKMTSFKSSAGAH